MDPLSFLASNLHLLWLIGPCIVLLLSFLIPTGKSCGPERPPYPTNPAERARMPMDCRCAVDPVVSVGDEFRPYLPPKVETLDHGIRTWLDRDDIAAWIEVATAAGYSVALMPERRHAPANGCGAKLEDGQWFHRCGETDMGQTGPALCTKCGGDFLRSPIIPLRQDDEE